MGRWRGLSPEMEARGITAKDNGGRGGRFSFALLLLHPIWGWLAKEEGFLFHTEREIWEKEVETKKVLFSGGLGRGSRLVHTYVVLQWNTDICIRRL